MSMKQDPNPVDRVWGAYLAAVVVVSAVFVARAPADSIRERPLGALTFIILMGCCGVAAEALWNRRRWRRRSVDAITLAYVLVFLARWAEMAAARTGARPFQVPEWLLNAPLFFLIVYLLTKRGRAWPQYRVPRP
jgi:drug/metabolite transporter (DMT)-like permease